MNPLTKPTALFAAAMFIVMNTASATIIDFEQVPGETAEDQTAISTQYLESYGVAFILSNGDTPYLEKRGGIDVGAGFKNNMRNEAPDIEALSHEGQFGNFFLRIGTENLSSGPVPDLLINYTTPVAAASGQIWDIDGTGFATETERWRVTAYDAIGQVLEIIDSPEGVDDGPGSLDGLPWIFSFDHASASISQIRFEFTGTKTESIGLAFDNYKPATASPMIRTVDIDVIPGDDRNRVFPNKAGFLPVAVLGDAEFDATQVDPTTLRFGAYGATPHGTAEIDDFDGAFGHDTKVQFSVADTGIACSDVKVSLTGETYAGEPISGTDMIDASRCQEGGCHTY